MKDFALLLQESVQRHGHLCAGQVIGVRMAMLGCQLVGIDDPTDRRYRKLLLVYVEIDRCATDAIASVTGCQLGRRTMKFKDYGINAATFVNLETKVAYRIVSTESSRQQVHRFAPRNTPENMRQVEAYKRMGDDLLFAVQRVAVPLPDSELPGPPRHHAVCDRCGQVVRDRRELVTREGETLCRPCGGGGYFRILESDSPLPELHLVAGELPA